jgi:hypothetical protein
MEDNIIFETQIDNAHYRIRQVSDDECIVEWNTLMWQNFAPVDDDAVCAQIYMQAMLWFKQDAQCAKNW